MLEILSVVAGGGLGDQIIGGYNLSAMPGVSVVFNMVRFVPLRPPSARQAYPPPTHSSFLSLRIRAYWTLPFPTSLDRRRFLACHRPSTGALLGTATRLAVRPSSPLPPGLNRSGLTAARVFWVVGI